MQILLECSDDSIKLIWAPIMYVVVMTYSLIDRSWIIFFFIYVRCCGIACVYFSFRWGPFMHSLGIVQWNSTMRDHPGNPGGVSGSGPISLVSEL